MRAQLFAACAATIAALACSGGSRSIEVSAPSADKCQVTVANDMSGDASPAGATGSLAVTTTRDCTWTAASAASWISLTTGARGQGSGTIGYRVAANGDASVRRGTVDVNNTQVTIVQDPAPCTFAVTPASISVPSQGSTTTESVQTLTSCTWSASIPVDWIRITEHPSGTGSGAVTLSVDANAGAGRSSNIVIAGKTVTVQQAGSGGAPPPAPTPSPGPAPAPEPTPGCTYAIGSSSANVGSDAETISVAVKTGADCSWSATSHESWITVASGGSGNGNGTVTLRVAGNSGASRTGTVTVAGRTFTVNQASAPCTYDIAPDRQSVPQEGANGTVAVTAGSTCSWSASSNASWITITSGSSGAGNGIVAFTVAANTTGSVRTGSLNVAGRTFTVNQAAPPAPPSCTLSIAPVSQSLTDAGGTGSISITASAATCAWSATANADWITLVSGVTGAGNGTVSFNVAPNTGAARTGTLTVAGQTFTISQAAPPAPCTFTISPSAVAAPPQGVTGTVAITASAPSCAWSATSTLDWITVAAPASGTGSATISFTVAPNSAVARAGTVTIAGQAFTVSQAGQ